VSISGVASASSHREAPAISEDPAADNTDLYAWVDAAGNNLIILANYIPLEEPAGGPNFHKFSDDVLYEVHLVRGGADLKDKLSYQIKFKTTYPAYVDPADMAKPVGGGKEFFSQIGGATQTYTLTKIVGATATDIAKDVPVAPPNIGPRTNAIAYGLMNGMTYETYATGAMFMKDMGAEGKVWAGPRDDGFYVDLGAVFDLAGICPATGCVAHDNVAGYNTHTIALSIPLKVANGGTDVVKGTPNTAQTVGVWASASRRKTRVLRANGDAEWLGPWTQVGRLGIPLINEAVIGLQDKDLWNRLRPADDVAYFGAYFLNPVVVRDAEFAGFYDPAKGGALMACNGKLANLKANRLDIVDVINLKNIPSANAHNIPLSATGDVLRVDLGIPSGFPNGRSLTPNANTEGADVTDVELGLLLTGLDPTCLPGFGGTVPDGVGANDKTFLAGFPYLASPWEGFADGHNSKGTR
jgi:hypothetical protein